MRFGVVFGVLGLGFAGGVLWALRAGHGASPLGWFGIVLLAWTSAAFGAGAIGWLWPHAPGRYRRVAWIYGKRGDGTRSWWSVVGMWPLLGPLWLWWHARRPHLREPATHRLARGLTIGRRLLDREFAREIGSVGVAYIVDLTCEYAESVRQREAVGYLSMPIVDGAAPPDDRLAAYARRIAALEGEVFVHCAEGHGRTALVTGAVLLLRGEVATADEALARIASIRPKATPYPEQRAALERFADDQMDPQPRRIAPRRECTAQRDDAGYARVMDSDLPPPDDKLEQHILENRRAWEHARYYDFAEPDMDPQWEQIIFPRLDGVDFTRTLELAPGHGRNTRRLGEHARNLVLVDLNKTCIDRCRERFGDGNEHCSVEYFVNNGLDLRDIRSESVTFVYSWDAMVHFERELLRRYLAEFARVLEPGGKVFMHHSNYAALPDAVDRGWSKNPHSRAFASAADAARFAAEAGLDVTDQELIDWAGVVEIDAITRLRKPADR